MKQPYPKSRIWLGVLVAVICTYAAQAAYAVAMALMAHLLHHTLPWKAILAVWAVPSVLQPAVAGFINILCWRGEEPPANQRLGATILCFGLSWILPCLWTGGFILFLVFLWIPLFALGIRLGMKFWYGGVLRQYLGLDLPEPRVKK